MKVLISILLISSLSFFTQKELLAPNLEDCKCSALNCSCKSGDCSAEVNCTCNMFSCNCACGTPYSVLPVANEIQNQNSEASEGYFKGLGTAESAKIAGYINTLRTAIANNDLKTYAENAPLLEAAFKSLPQAEQDAYLLWIFQNLTPVKN